MLSSEGSCPKKLRKYFFIVGISAILLLIVLKYYGYLDTGRNDPGMISSAKSQNQGNAQANQALFVPHRQGQVLPDTNNRQNLNQAAKQQHRESLVFGPNSVLMPTSPGLGVAVGMNKNPGMAVAQHSRQTVVNISAIGKKPTLQNNGQQAVANPDAKQPAQPGANAPMKAKGPGFVNPFSGKSITSIGSGVILSQEGYILTNYHVVKDVNEIYVTVFSGQATIRHIAEIVILSEKTDLALLKIQPESQLVPASFNNQLPMVGEEILAIGSPFGLDQTVSKGVVSAVNKSVTISNVTHRNLIQTDAAVNRGNSGGPLVNMQGQVVGINTAIYTPNGAFSGIGFAIPASQAMKFVKDTVIVSNTAPRLSPQQTQMQGAVMTPRQRFVPQDSMVDPATSNMVTEWIGARLERVNNRIMNNLDASIAGGAFLTQVQPGSRADQEGLAQGDVIFMVDGRRVDNPNDVLLFTENNQGTARISVMRQGQKRNIYINMNQ